MDFPDHPFWDFSLAVYGTEGVPEACLALQERHGVDVNVLLFCNWLGAAGYPARNERQIGAMIESTGIWHAEIVKGLRRVRRRMKERIARVDHELAQKLRSAVQAAEIDAEHLEQLALAGLVAGEQPKSVSQAVQRENARSNTEIYLAQIGAQLSTEDLGNLARLADAAVPAD